MQSWFFELEGCPGMKVAIASSELEALRQINARRAAIEHTGKVQVWSLKRMMRGPIERASA